MDFIIMNFIYLCTMIEKQPLHLNKTFKYALDFLEKSNGSAFITGRAGTGKSTLLTLFRNSTRKKVVVVAPTGVAALNVQGQTIHSFFGFPAKPLQRQDIRRRRNRSLYRNMQVLVIDEISMVRADLLDNIDYFLQINRDSPLPFGGVQVVFFGDLFQLPPVVSTMAERELFSTVYDSPYFFSANVFNESFELEFIELTETYRQESAHFVRLLDAVRVNQIDYDDLEDLNTRHIPEFKSPDFYITLSSRNSIVNKINQERLAALQSDEYTYLASVSGNFSERLTPAEPALRLKTGAQVMFVKNDPQRRFVNGTIGKVIKLMDDEIHVLIENAAGEQKVINVEKLKWEMMRYQTNDATDPANISTETIGSYTQYPLRLAWAITIHKSQGKTFDKIIIDLGRGAFEHGQTYVALSRCRTLEGIVLRQSLTGRDIIIDERVVEFFEQNF